jgi:hypothetical protein
MVFIGVLVRVKELPTEGKEGIYEDLGGRLK